ncbi:hypothetical protein [Streptomyces sp. TLI_146]|uniref:hypothetical protein n=1 Tax=Streptomyces sp. TLI_146 TaxID=1938858 RepID=UPI000CA72B07|nr:hypothetical protein [Streptomyces sp. TLI_146]PKV84341.1 hypothetical protein BX283_1859 [Streptomyces sp. TLI_146]
MKPAQEPGHGAPGTSAANRATNVPKSAAPGKVSAAFQLPLTAYRPTGAEYTRIEEAKADLTRQCMEGLGFTGFQPAPVQSLGPGRDGADAMEDLDDLRYGTYDSTQAANNGYKPEFVVNRTNAFVDHPAPPDRSPDEWLALTGTKKERSDAPQSGLAAPRLKSGATVPYGGCIYQSLQKVTGGKPVIADLVINLSGQSFKSSLEDRRVKGAFADWSSCMKSKGYSYTDPMKANDDPKFSAKNATAAEIETAKADVACKNKVDLIKTWNSVDVEIQKRLIQEHSAELYQIKQDKDSALKIAASVNSRD